MKRFWLFILSFFLLIFLPGLQSHNPISPHSVNELADLAARGITHRFLDNDLIELREEWSGQTFVGSLRELDIEQIYAWADTEGVPIWTIDPSEIDTSQFSGWFSYWTEVPLSNDTRPLVSGDLDGNGRTEFYGIWQDFDSDFDGRIYEVDSSGDVTWVHTYELYPGQSRAIVDSDGDSFLEVAFSFGGDVTDYEQSNSRALPLDLNFIHDRTQGNLTTTATEIYFGSLDGDNLVDFLYRGSESDSSDTTQGILMNYVTEFSADSNNFERVWSAPDGTDGFAVGDFDNDGMTDFA